MFSNQRLKITWSKFTSLVHFLCCGNRIWDFDSSSSFNCFITNNIIRPNVNFGHSIQYSLRSFLILFELKFKGTDTEITFTISLANDSQLHFTNRICKVVQFPLGELTVNLLTQTTPYFIISKKILLDFFLMILSPMVLNELHGTKQITYFRKD